MTLKTIELSPTRLNLFQECPLCFWLHQVRGIHRPEGPASTLPRGMDILIKNYFDSFRKKEKLPPDIEGRVEGKLLEQALIDKWRHWKTGLRYEDKKLKAVLFGALDECLVHGDKYIPVDYKTRGFDLKEDSTKYYQTQLDCYTYLLEANGRKTPSYGYLIYYIPKQIKKQGLVQFEITPIKMKTDAKRGLKVFQEAVKVLRGPKPEAHSGCDFCSWGNDFLSFE